MEENSDGSYPGIDWILHRLANQVVEACSQIRGFEFFFFRQVVCCLIGSSLVWFFGVVSMSNAALYWKRSMPLLIFSVLRHGYDVV